MFTMDVGSDLYGTKHNVQLCFNSRPSVAELAAACESFFDTKARACRPAGYPDTLFRIETFQVFDDKLMRWVDLYDGAQLQPQQQVWCFQSESIWHSDAQGVIPEAENGAFTWTTPLGSPKRGRVAADAGVPPTLSEKLRSVFYQVDLGGKGFLVYSDLEQAFRRCDMEFNGANAGDLFQLADSRRQNRITYDEWVNFAIRFPNVVDALFFRFRDMPGGAPGGMVAPSPTGAQERQTQLEQYYHESWQPSARDQQAAEFDAARTRVRAQELQSQMQAVGDRQRQAADAAQAAMAQQEAAAQEAARIQAELQQVEEAAARAAEAQHLQQQAAQQQQEAAAAQQRAQAAQAQAAQAAAAAARAAPAPVPQQYSQQPSYAPPMQSQPQYAPVPSSSPQRDDALSQYEAARRHADAIRFQKEEAEREERNAWDRLYYSPASPHYAPQGQH